MDVSQESKKPWGVRANEVLTELEQTVLPKLEEEERRLLAVRVRLGLRNEQKATGEWILSYDRPLTEKEAEWKARAEILGPEYVSLNQKQAHSYKRVVRIADEMKRIEKGIQARGDEFADRELRDRYSSLEILHYRNKAKFEGFSKGILRLEARVADPVVAAQIEARKKDLLAMEQVKGRQREEVDSRYRATREALLNGRDLASRLGDLGTTQIMATRGPNLTGEGRFFAAPHGSDFQEWTRAAEAFREQSRVYQMTRGM